MPYLLNLATTLPLAGLIWTVQVVHYPLMASVGTDAFPEYHRRHKKLMTLVVAPLMLAELAAAVWLVAEPAPLSAPEATAAAALVAVVWASTAFLQVPQHERLAKSLDRALVRRLVAGNWIRTAAWTARALLLLAAA